MMSSGGTGPVTRAILVNETANSLIEPDIENQSCSGNILAKLQCIRIPDPDTEIEDLRLEESTRTQVTSQENMENQSGDNGTPIQPVIDGSISDIDKNNQSCSGSILTTLQCIKMPLIDSDTISNSSSDSAYLQSPQSLEDKINETVEWKESIDISVVRAVPPAITSGEVDTGSPDNELVQIISKSDNINEENREQPKQRNLSVASSVSESSIASTNSNTTNNTPTATEGQVDDAALNYVRRLLENDPNVDRGLLADILWRQAEFDNDLDIQEFDTSLDAPVNLPQLYPMGNLVYEDCEVCIEKKDINLRTCCDKPVCDECMVSFITIQVQQAIVKIHCPTTTCDKFVHRDEVMTRLTGEMKDKFYKYLVDANKDPHIKTCPQCSTVMTVEPGHLRNPKVKKKGLCVTCNGCLLEWCFTCQAPWHAGIKCNQFREGDKLFKRWTKEQHFGQPNARKCPKCRIFIQRSTGCDHMRCSKCNTDFCYQCGEKFLHLKFIGDHYSRFSIFGCKYRLYPHSAVRRKLIRGSIFGSKLLLTPVIAGLLVGAGAVILAGGIFILPVWAGFRIRRHLREKEARKRERAYRDHWQKRREEIKQIGDPYLENFNHMNSLGLNPYHVGGSFGKGGVLRVDELDMRLPHIQLDSLSLTSLDNNSSADSYVEGGVPSGQRIKLSPNSLDIHASLDAEIKPQVIQLEPVHEVNIENSDGVKFTRIDRDHPGDLGITETDDSRNSGAAGSSVVSNNGARPKVPKTKTPRKSRSTKRNTGISEKESSVVNKELKDLETRQADIFKDTTTNCSSHIETEQNRNRQNPEANKSNNSNRRMKQNDFRKDTVIDCEDHVCDPLPHLICSYIDESLVVNDATQMSSNSPVTVHRSNSNYEVWI